MFSQSGCYRFQIQMTPPVGRAQNPCIYDGKPLLTPFINSEQMQYKANVLQYPQNRNDLSQKEIYSRMIQKLWKNRNKTYGTQTDSYTNPNTNSLKRVDTTFINPVSAFNDIYNSQLQTFMTDLSSNSVYTIEPKINPISFPNQQERMISAQNMATTNTSYNSTTSTDNTNIYPLNNPSLFPSNQPSAIINIPPFQYANPPVDTKTIPPTYLPTPLGTFTISTTTQNPPSFTVSTPEGGVLLCNQYVDPITLEPTFSTVSYQPCHSVTCSNVPIERTGEQENVLCDYTFVPIF